MKLGSLSLSKPIGSPTHSPFAEKWTAVSLSLFLFILPITHTVAIRLFCLGTAALIVAYQWYKSSSLHVPIKWSIVLWAVICWSSAFWSIDLEYSLGELRNEVGYTIICFLVFYYLAKNQNDWQRWQNALLAGSYFISIYALANYFYHNSWFTGGRVGDRNAYSTYVVLIFPYLLTVCFIKETSQLQRKITWGAIALILISGTFTLNRIMWTCLSTVTIVFFSLYYLASYKNKVALKKGGLVGVLLLIITVIQFVLISYYRAETTVMPPHISETVKPAPISYVIQPKNVVTNSNQPHQNLSIKESFNNNLRFKIWPVAFKYIEKKPIIGYGYGRGILRKDFRNELDMLLLWHAHNIWLNYMLEVGLIGTLAFGLLTFSLSREYWKLYKSSNDHASLYGIFGLSIMISLGLKTFTDDVLIREISLLFWAFAGMILGLGRRLIDSDKKTISTN